MPLPLHLKSCLDHLLKVNDHLQEMGAWQSLNLKMDELSIASGMNKEKSI